MSRRRYTMLASDEVDAPNQEDKRKRVGDDEYEFSEAQFLEPTRPLPWKTVLFIAYFILMGTGCLSFGIYLLVSSSESAQEWDRITALMILGSIMFIPGAYYGYILINALCGSGGYSLNHIPEL